MDEVLFLNKYYWVARIMKPCEASMLIYHILEAKVHWNFSFRAFHDIQFQVHFMKHEILSWNTFTLVSKFHFLFSSSIKKLSLQRQDIFWQPKFRTVTHSCSVKKVVLKIFKNSQKNTYARVSFLIKFIKKRLWKRCFPVNFVKFSGP